MKVHQAGVRSVAALMGAVLYGTQRSTLLERFRRVILFLDGDPTGRRASTVIAQQLRPLCSVKVVGLPGGIQPDELSAKDICNILQPLTSDD